MHQDDRNKNKSDAYRRNQTHDPSTPEQETSSDAYERNETHDPSAKGHAQSSNAYERNLKSNLVRNPASDEEE
jgi:hypothetical protein